MMNIHSYLCKKYGNSDRTNQYYHVPNVFMTKIFAPIFSKFIYKPTSKYRKPAYVSESVKGGWYVIVPVNTMDDKYIYDIMPTGDYESVKERVNFFLEEVKRLDEIIKSSDKRVRKYFEIHKSDIKDLEERMEKELQYAKENRVNLQMFNDWIRYPTFLVHIVNVNSEKDIEYLETLSKLIKEK